MLRPHRKRASRQGFSLVEMMIVVVLIGILTAMIAPGLNEFMADTRHSGAAEAMLRLHRAIRGRVNETGLAHLVRFDSTTSNNTGTVLVYEGMNNHCSTTPWQQAVVNGAANNQYVVDSLDMAEYNHGAHRITLTATRLVGGSGGTVTAFPAIDLCFQPNGMTMVRTSTNAVWTFAPLREPVLFSVARTVDGISRGVTRQVIWPIGGNARLKI